MAGELKSGRYEIGKELGHGGMGVVYRARDTRLGRSVAIKTLPRHLTHDSELHRRLVQEARAASALSHPGIATVYDFEEEGGESFIVYEYVEGTTLREQLHRHRFTTEEILEIGIQLADALVAAQDCGITHRDLKPENIMVVSGPERLGRVKILDFGLAKLRQPLTPAVVVSPGSAETVSVSTASGLLVGTVNYMAPEQLEGEVADARTDLYAAGLVLYELATGSNPFVGKTPTSTIANILKQEPPAVVERNPVAPAELDRILRKCLRKRREERYQSARELAVDLSNLRRDLTLAGARPESSRTVATPPAPLTISRGLSRGLFLLIQVGYLAMYGAAFHYLPNIQSLRMSFPAGNVAMLVAFCALCGAAVRLYLLSAVGFDYPDTGRLFRRLFPGILILDLAWSVSPLLLFPKLGDVTLLFVAGLAYLPFSQRTLLHGAYASSGGRTSGLKTPGSV